MSITRPVDPERPAGPVDPLPPGSPVCKGRVVYRRQWRGRRDHTTFVGVWLSAAPGCRGLSYPARSHRNVLHRPACDQRVRQACPRRPVYIQDCRLFPGVAPLLHRIPRRSCAVCRSRVAGRRQVVGGSAPWSSPAAARRLRAVVPVIYRQPAGDHLSRPSRSPPAPDVPAPARVTGVVRGHRGRVHQSYWSPLGLRPLPCPASSREHQGGLTVTLRHHWRGVYLRRPPSAWHPALRTRPPVPAWPGHRQDI